jgi:uncharacterized protein (TIGR01777 family)
MIGQALISRLKAEGHNVLRLVRGAAGGEGTASWDPQAGRVDTAALAGCDAVVHLAGENIAAARWSAAVKERIRRSRVRGTEVLAEALTGMADPPRTFVCASAVGYYGDRGDEVLTEESPPGSSYLAEVCVAWENATRPAEDKGLRVVRLRIGLVLSAKGGALPRMLPPFRLGAGGRIGTGRQYVSWIDLDDLVGIFLRALSDESLRGAVNAVAPNPVTNAEFTRALGAVLHRPTIFPMPAAAARLAFGEMADALLLASARVLPKKLTAAGHEFRFPRLEESLAHQLRK